MATIKFAHSAPPPTSYMGVPPGRATHVIISVNLRSAYFTFVEHVNFKIESLKEKGTSDKNI